MFLTQDTYRGSRSRTATLNYYAYCAGNPVSYTDPSGHHPVLVAIAKIAGVALTVYGVSTGYKAGVNKAKSKGRKKAGQVATGVAYAAASMINPSKVASAAGKVISTISKTKVVNKVTTAVKNAVSKPKTTNVDSKNAKSADNNSPPREANLKKKTLSQIDIERYAMKATKGPKDATTVVLGRYETGKKKSYDVVAKKLNAQYFNLDDFDELAETYGRNEMWRINEKFLDNQISSGRNIIFSHNPNKAITNSYFRREVDYLIERGYSFKKKGRYWHAYKAE